mgnify:CR=1 FL=1
MFIDAHLLSSLLGAISYMVALGVFFGLLAYDFFGLLVRTLRWAVRKLTARIDSTTREKAA